MFKLTINGIEYKFEGLITERWFGLMIVSAIMFFILCAIKYLWG